MCDHEGSISAIADNASVSYRGRAFFPQAANPLGMASEAWRDRLAAEIDRQGRSMRSVSKDAGLGAGYLHGVLKDGKDMTVGNMIQVASVLDVSLVYLLLGLDVTPETVEVVQALEGNPARRKALLELLADPEGDQSGL
jgi:lambda repressor-like predicted transcriptional regulator